MTVRIFGFSIAVTIAALIAAYVYAGWNGLAVCAILAALEISLSFDNAVINASILRGLSRFWQQMFLTVGIIIAVFGMRLVFPLAIVWVTAGLGPAEAFRLALNPPADGALTFPDGSKSYELLLTQAHPQIAAFGGMFLLMLFLDFLFRGGDHRWIRIVETPLARLGALPSAAVIVALCALLLTASTGHEQLRVLIAGLLGLLTFLLVNGLTGLFSPPAALTGQPGRGGVPALVGKAAFFSFLYLEVLDASFSFDGVIGAFAITSDPILIALGLGFIGAMFVRSITIYLVKAGSLAQYRYLENGAHWAIGALAVILLVSIHLEINDVVTGLTGLVFIGAALVSSIRANRRFGMAEEAVDVERTGQGQSRVIDS